MDGGEKKTLHSKNLHFHDGGNTGCPISFNLGGPNFPVSLEIVILYHIYGYYITYNLYFSYLFAQYSSLSQPAACE